MSITISSNLFCKYLTNKENIITTTTTASASDNNEQIAYNLAFYYARRQSFKNAKKIAKNTNEIIISELEVRELNINPNNLNTNDQLIKDINNLTENQTENEII